MTETGYLILAISILVALLVIFVVSFVLYRKTPVPKGCENLTASDAKCASCEHSECRFYQKDKEEDK